MHARSHQNLLWTTSGFIRLDLWSLLDGKRRTPHLYRYKCFFMSILLMLRLFFSYFNYMFIIYNDTWSEGYPFWKRLFWVKQLFMFRKPWDLDPPFLGVKDTLSQQIKPEDVLGLSQNDRPPPNLLEMVQLKFEGTRFEQLYFDTFQRLAAGFSVSWVHRLCEFPCES